MEENASKIKKEKCPHLKEIKITISKKTKCEVCNEINHLRVCASCGFVGCCESSNAHDTEHFKKTNHPIIRTIHTNYNFTWCYKCNSYLV